MDFHLWLYPFYCLLLCRLIEGSIDSGAERRCHCVRQTSLLPVRSQSERRVLINILGAMKKTQFTLFSPLFPFCTFIRFSSPPLTSQMRQTLYYCILWQVYLGPALCWSLRILPSCHILLIMHECIWPAWTSPPASDNLLLFSKQRVGPLTSSPRRDVTLLLRALVMWRRLVTARVLRTWD